MRFAAFTANVLFSLLLTIPSFGECLKLRPGTLSLGGQITVPLLVSKDGAFSTDVNISPQIGYFPLSQLEMIVDFSYLLSTARGQSSLLTEYIFLTETPIFPYVGAGFGVIFGGPEVKLVPKVPVGILIALGPCVALDIQVLLEAQFSPSSGFEQFSITPGYFGIRGFF